MRRLRLLCAALVGTLAAVFPQSSGSAPPDPSSAEPSSAKHSGLRFADDAEAASLLLPSAAVQQQLIARLIQREVDAALRRARQTMALDPSAVIQDLKSTLEHVLAAPELGAEQRAGLRGRLAAALREANRREIELEQQRLEREQVRAAAQERARVLGGLDRGQERLKQLLDRFDSLLLEGHYDLAGEVARQAESDRSPDAEVVGGSALRNVSLAGATQGELGLRIKRQQGVVHALEQVELASVAQPGDEPIIYPQAQRWQEMTVRRAKYARTDLHQSTPAEARLSRALAETTSFDFVEISLGDAIEYLKDLHGIEIQFDSKALQDDGIDVEVPVTRKLSGISLRSALRLLLGALDLTYTIENEVLLITTPDRAARRVVAKVYPVGELVLPITTPSFNRGFGPPMGFGGQGGSGQNGSGQNGGGGNPPNAFGQNQNNGPLGQGIF